MLGGSEIQQANLSRQLDGSICSIEEEENQNILEISPELKIEMNKEPNENAQMIPLIASKEQNNRFRRTTIGALQEILD